MSSSDSRVLHVRQGQVAVLTINRPEAANAVDDAMAEAIGTALEDANLDPGVGAVVITGAGSRSFSAGTDLRALPTTEAGSSATGNRGPWDFAGLVRHPIDKPVVAAVNGAAVGGGAEIVLACDLAVAGDAAYLQFPEARIGLYAGAGGAFRLPTEIGSKRAMAALLLGEPITATEAAEWGLVNAVVPHGTALEEAVGVAERLAQLPRASVRATLRIARAARLAQEDFGWAASVAELHHVEVGRARGSSPSEERSRQADRS
ncbi:enoyl-CoA hydratase/isomerase family protein [Micromonospora inositola]|nr:enoyl-CoA hydratase-related protein [Micromonospora inositola]